MTKNLRRFLILSAFIASFAAPSARAEDAGFNDAQKSQIQQVVKDYIAANPEIIFQALQAYQDKKQEQDQADAAKMIEQNIGALTAKDLPSAGNPNGDVTVVEFYDYNCGYCKKAFSDVKSIIENDKNVRFVFHDLPILGPTSEIAARWSMAAFKQGKFYEFHTAMMEQQDHVDEAMLERVATQVGLNVDQVKKDADSAEIKDAVNKSRDMALSMQIHGTPGFVIGKKLYPGYIGPDGFKRAIADARAGK